MSDIYARDNTTGKYRLVRKHDAPDIKVRHSPLLTLEQIEMTRSCPTCGDVYRQCRCAPPAPAILAAPPKPGLVVQARRPGQPRLFQNEAHAALACSGCGRISLCTCGVQPPPSLDQVLQARRQQQSQG